MASGPLQLDDLYVSVTARTEPFLAAMTAVENKVAQVDKFLTAFSGRITSIMTQVMESVTTVTRTSTQFVSGALRSMVGQIETAAATVNSSPMIAAIDPASLTAVRASIEELMAYITTRFKEIPAIIVRTTIAPIGGGAADIGPITEWLKGLNKLKPELEKLTDVITKIPTTLEPLAKFLKEAVDLSSVQYIKSLSPLVNWLATAKTLGPGLASLRRILADGKLPNLTPLTEWLKTAAELPFSQLSSTSIGPLSRWIKRLNVLATQDWTAFNENIKTKLPKLVPLWEWVADAAAMQWPATMPDLAPVAGFVGNLNRIYPDIKGLGAVIEDLPQLQPLRRWLRSMADMPGAGKLPNLTTIGTFFARMGGFAKNISQADLDKIPASIAPLQEFARKFSEFANESKMLGDAPALRQLSLSMQRIAMLARSLTRVDVDTFTDQAARFTTGVTRMVTDLSGITGLDNLDLVGKLLGKLGGFLKTMSAFKGGFDFQAVVTDIADFTRQLGAINLAGADPILKAMSRISGFLRTMPKFKGGFDFKAVVTDITDFTQQLSAISLTGIDSLLKSFTKIGAFLRVMEKFKGGFDFKAIITDITDFTQQLSAISLTGIDPLFKSLGKLGTFLKTMDKFQGGFDFKAIITDLSDFAAQLGTIDITKIGPLTKQISKIGSFLRLVSGSKFNLNHLTDPTNGVPAKLKLFFEDLKNSIPSTAIDAVKPLGVVLNNLAGFLRLVPKVDMSRLGGTNGIPATLKTFIDDLNRNILPADVSKIKPLGTVLNSLAGFLRFVPKFDADKLAGPDGIPAKLGKFVADMNDPRLNLVGGAGALKPLGTVLSNLGGFLRTISSTKFDTTALGTIPNDLKIFFTELNQATLLANVAAVDPIAKVLSKLGSFLRSVPKMDMTKLSGVPASLQKFIKGIVDIPDLESSVEKMKPLTMAMSRMGGFLRVISGAKFGTLGITNLAGLPNTLKSFVKEIATISDADITKITGLGNAIAKMGSFLRLIPKMGAFDSAAMLAQGKALVQWINLFSGVSSTTVNTVSLLGKALSGMARFMTATGGVGANLPPIMNNVTNSVSGIPPVANNARWGLYGLRNMFRDITSSSMAAAGSLTSFKMTMAGMAGFSIYFFGKFDDALTRTLAHMREWPELASHMANRSVLTQAVVETSSNSITGVTDLAKGLDLLASRGMSASMATKALAIAQQFAVTSGMQMEEATRHLVDLQFTLGMASQNVEEHYKNMTMISDRLVGIAPMVGSSVQQLTEAIGNRFVAAMELSNMSLEEGIALLGVYSERNIRGTEASDRAYRALVALSKQSIENIGRFEALGVKVYDADLKMRGIADIVDDLTTSLGGMGTMAATSKLIWMGFEQRTIAAILPLVGMGDELRRLQGEMGKTDGIMQKTADMLKNSVGNQLKIIFNNLVNGANAIGSVFAPAIRGIATGLGSLTKWLLTLNPAVQHLIALTAAVTVSFGPLLMVATYLGGFVVKSLISSFMALASIIVIPFRLVFAAVSGVVAVARGLVFFMLAPFQLAVATARLAWTAVTSIASALMSVGKAVYNTLSSIIGGIYTFVSKIGTYLEELWVSIKEITSATWGWIKAIASFPITVFLWVEDRIGDLIAGFKSLWKWITDVSAAMSVIFLKLGGSVLTMAVNLAGSIALIAVNVATFIAGLAIMAVLIIPIMTALVSLVSALGAAIGSLTITSALVAFPILKGIVAGIVILWGTFKTGVATAFGFLVTGIKGLGDGIVNFWNGFKDGAATTFASIGSSISKLAGFIWNFGRNVVIIWEWIAVNWAAAVRDMANVLATFIERTAANFVTLFTTIWNIGVMIWKRLWGTARDFVMGTYDWITGRWQSILAEMTNVFMTFVRGLVRNFMILWDVLADIIGNKLAKAGAFGPAGKLFAKNMDYEKMLEGAYGKMKNPFDRFDARPAKKQLESLANLWKQLGIGAGSDFKDLGKGILGELTGGLDKLISPFIDPAKLTAPWTELADKIITTLPGKSTIDEMLKGLLKPFTSHEDLPGTYGKGTTGFQFKQISESRYMVGGDSSKVLDYQQLQHMRLTAENTRRIKEILEGQKQNPPVKVMGPLK